MLQEKIKIKRERLEKYYAAEEAILGGAQSYAIGSRNLTRANLETIKQMIKQLEGEIADLENQLNGTGARRAVAVVSRDF